MVLLVCEGTCENGGTWNNETCECDCPAGSYGNSLCIFDNDDDNDGDDYNFTYNSYNKNNAFYAKILKKYIIIFTCITKTVTEIALYK